MSHELLSPAPTVIPEQFNDVKDKQASFINTLREFSQHFDQRLKDIENQFILACNRQPERQIIYENNWKQRIYQLRKKLARLKDMAGHRPSLCVMGKRGQGKTSLLQNWLAKYVESGQMEGIEEIGYFPTGESDATSCLIRLTLSDKERDDLLPYYLYIEMFPPEFRPDIAKPHFPANLMGKTIKLSRLQGDGDPTNPYRVCRFPGGDDENYRLEEAQNHYTFGIDGGLYLTAVQWHAKQVKVPVDISPDSVGLGHQVIHCLDIIDAPGADSMQQGDFPEWKKAKNSQVFQSATHELDVLLVVTSANVDAMNIGNQFQEDVWKPWLNRCQGSGIGRILLAVTHSAYLFKTTKLLLEAETAKRDRLRNPSEVAPANKSNKTPRPQKLHDANFRLKLTKNVLDPLMIETKEAEAIIKQNNLQTWPLIFFFENSLEELAEYLLPEGQSKLIAEKLIEKHQQSPEKASEDETLSLGERCILRLVQDWNDLPAPAPERAAVQIWLIRALAAVLDPEDRGFKLLTHTVISYATTGPVAQNHCQERLNAIESIWLDFEELFSDIGKPGSQESALNELRLVRTYLQSIWDYRNGLLGLNLRQGQATKRRLDDVKHNKDITELEKREFTLEQIIQDIVQDVAVQFPKLSASGHDAAVKRALQESLAHDYPFLALEQRYRNIYHTKVETLLRIQAAGMERIARIITYLANANDAALRQVAIHCYQENLDANALLQSLVSSEVGIKNTDDLEHLDDVRRAGEVLLSTIQSAHFKPPYQPI